MERTEKERLGDWPSTGKNRKREEKKILSHNEKPQTSNKAAFYK